MTFEKFLRFSNNKKAPAVIYRFEDLEKRRRSTWLMSALLLVSLGVGFFLTLVPGEFDNIKPLFGTLPVLRLGLLVLLVLLSVYIVKGEIESARLLRELWDKKVNIDGLNQRVMELSVLHDVSAAINSMLDLDKTTNVIMDSAFKLMTAEAGFVIVVGEDGEFRILCSRGLPKDAPENLPIGETQGVLSQAWREGRIVLAGDTANDELLGRLMGSDRKLASAICAPLKQKNHVTGLFCLGSMSYKDGFDNRDAELLAIFADQVAIALENGRLFRNLQKSLAELKEAQARMVQTGKLAAVGQLAAGVAHELNNPIVGILGYSQYAIEKIKGKQVADLTPKDLENYQKYVGYIEHESQRCKIIIQNLLNFSRKGSTAMTPTDVNKVLETTFALLSHQLQMHNVRLVPELGPELPPVLANASELQQVFTNLIVNAQKAMEKGGSLTVTTRRKAGVTEGDGAVEMLFTDTGCGIAPEHMTKIFDPFFTTRKVGEGTGLGLSLSHGILKNHGGEISVESVVGQGTTFTISLPVNRAVPPATATAPEAPAYSVAVAQAR